ncbi:MAG: phenylacetate--CoA ligase [Gammaproteobacteria bacterium]|nr:phenylacetate--CoA ligase [Gammaproteobacteria bacterium]
MSEQLFWNAEMETKSMDEIHDIQWQKLQKQIKYIYQNSPDFYRPQFVSAGVRPEDIESFEDFRKLPIMRNKEMDRAAQLESMDRYGHSYGTYLCAPLNDVIHIYSTSGTSGEPSFYTFTEQDMKINDECWARTFWRAGIRPGDTVLHGFGLSMWSAGVPIVRALASMGARPIAAGAEGGIERMLMFAHLTKPTALVGTPSLAEYIIEKCPKILGYPASGLGIKTLVVAGAPGAGLPEVRHRITEGFGGAKLFDSSQGAWGLGNVSCDSNEYQGMHVISPEHCIWTDLVDPNSKEPIVLEDGAIGEGVITAFDHQAGPPFRYAFGDTLQLFTAPCSCGTPGWRFKILGRVDDLLNVKGIKVYPAAVRNVINSFAPRTTGEMRIVLDSPPPAVNPPLRIKVEYGVGLIDTEIEALCKELVVKLKNRLRFTAEIEMVKPESLERSTLKGKLIEKTFDETIQKED